MSFILGLQYHYTNSIGYSYYLPARGELTSQGLKIQTTRKQFVIKFDDILRVSTFEKEQAVGSQSFELLIEALPKQLRKPGVRKWGRDHRQLVTHRLSLSSQEGQAWIVSLQSGCNSQNSRQMLALINPKSGRGKAKTQLISVMPILEKCNIHLQVAELRDGSIFSKGKRQPFLDFFQALDLTVIDGIIVCGGDGTIHSTINALMSRPDWAEAMKTPVGVLPSGTDNGLCKTILSLSKEAYSLTNAAFIIAKQSPKPLDIFKIQQGQRLFYGVHSIAWGLVSDIDVHSNRLKFLGSLKEWIYGAAYILRGKRYAGHVDFEPQSVVNDNAQATKHMQLQQYIGLWAMNVPWAGKDWFTAPFAKLNDGLMDLLIFPHCLSRRELITSFLKMKDGSHFQSQTLEHYKTPALSLQPEEITGVITVDGEATNARSMHVEVLPGCCSVFCG